MKLSREEAVDRVFVLTAVDLDELHRAFTNFGTTPTYRATCGDHATREFVNLEELKGYENLPGTHIVALHLKSQATNPDREATLILHEFSVKAHESRTPNVWININGPLEPVRDLNQAINERLKAMEPWYSWVSGTAPMKNLGLFILASVAAYLVHRIFTKYDILSQSNRGLAAIGSWFGFLFLFGYVRSQLFPAGVFSIKDGEKRHKTRELVRWGVVIAFLASLISSVFAAWVT